MKDYKKPTGKLHSTSEKSTPITHLPHILAAITSILKLAWFLQIFID
jgi:hypothetical protein